MRAPGFSEFAVPTQLAWHPQDAAHALRTGAAAPATETHAALDTGMFGDFARGHGSARRSSAPHGAYGDESHAHAYPFPAAPRPRRGFRHPMQRSVARDGAAGEMEPAWDGQQGRSGGRRRSDCRGGACGGAGDGHAARGPGFPGFW